MPGFVTLDAQDYSHKRWGVAGLHDIRLRLFALLRKAPRRYAALPGARSQRVLCQQQVNVTLENGNVMWQRAGDG